MYDCIIVGGGPGGLIAGTYLGRFRCRICLIDNKDSRAGLIPISHNFPGEPQGIAGEKILANLRQQYENYQNEILNSTVIDIDKHHTVFTVTTSETQLQARYVILATGVVDVEPALPNLTAAIKNGLIRHCLVCDGFEIINKKIALIGEGSKVLNEAILLKTYTSDITVFLPSAKCRFSQQNLTKIKQHQLRIIYDPLQEVVIDKNIIVALKTSKQIYYFDHIYSALGCLPRTELAIRLGAKHRKDKRLLVSKHQQTSIANLYAVGDITSGLSQMCVAMAEGAVAAVDIFNKIKGGDA